MSISGFISNINLTTVPDLLVNSKIKIFELKFINKVITFFDKRVNLAGIDDDLRVKLNCGIYLLSHFGLFEVREKRLIGFLSLCECPCVGCG